MPRHQDPLEGVRLKLARADDHLLALADEEAAFLGRDPYRFEGHLEADGKEYVFGTRITEHPPPRLSAIAGDAVQNMRSALEHLAWALAGKNASDKTGFPVVLRANKYAAASKKKVYGIGQAAQTEIERLQPYHGPGAPVHHQLWMLHELARIDRHRILNVVGMLPQHFDVPRFGNVSPHNLVGTHYVGSLLEVDTEIGQFVFDQPLPPDAEVTPRIFVRVAFDDATPAPRLPIVSGLREIYAHLDTQILPRFEPYL